MALHTGGPLLSSRLLAIFTVLTAVQTLARGPEVTASLRVVGGDFYATAAAPGGALIPELKLRMDANLPVTFTYRFQFYRVRHLWFDKSVAERQVVRRASYDPLSALYRLENEVNGVAAPAQYVRDRQDAEFFLEHFDAVGIGPAGLDRPTPAGLRARLRVHFLAGTVLFIPWDMETGWREIAVSMEEPVG
jgi:hypothetical protein